MAKDFKKKKDLGKGLGVLLSGISADLGSAGENQVGDDGRESGVAMIKIEDVEVNPWQPRIEFEQEELEELSESIKVHGIIQPITVRRLNNARVSYQLISGERRLRASQIAELKEVPAYIIEATDQEMIEMALIENIQRADLTPLELAETYRKLRQDLRMEPAEISRRVAKKESTIRNYIRLLNLPEPIREALKNKDITMGHAKALLGLEDPIAQNIVFKQVKDNNLSVRATEALCDGYKNPKKNIASTKKQSPKQETAHRDVQDRIRDILQSKVELKVKSSGKGQIVVNFDGVDDLNRILDLLEKNTF